MFKKVRQRRGVMERDIISPTTAQAEMAIPAFEGYNKNAFEEEESQPVSGPIIEQDKITSILIDSDIPVLNFLEDKLNHHCPYIAIKGKFNCPKQAKTLINTQSPDLVFFGSGFEQENYFHILNQTDNSRFETIFISEKGYLDNSALQYNFSGCLHKPIQVIQLLSLVQRVQQKILQYREYLKNKELLENFRNVRSQKDIIGIPTLDGYDFLPIEKIIYCRGMQKCTRFITSDQSDILSSYNIGEFRKLLQPFGFFSPHKSFLINLSKIRKFHKEGTLTTTDNHHIPLARRRRESFLLHIKKDLKFPIIPKI